ncbi:MAG: translation initiation factor IF-2 [Opitutales bacterium]
MSVRVYEISKQLGLDNKEVIALLQERGLKVTSPSNTIDNISARSFLDEMDPQGSNGNVATAVEEADTAPVSEADTETPAPVAANEASPPTPPKRFVKSAKEVEDERQKKAEAAKPAPAPPKAPAAVVRPAPAAAQPAPAPRSPVVPPPRQSGPAGKAPTPPPSRAPAVPPRENRPPAGAPIVPPRENRPPAGAPPAPAANRAASAPSLPPRAPAPPPPSPEGEPTAEAAPASGETRLIHAKPPIVVRDFATLIGLKPFKLISELMEMNIFASMNQVIDEEVAVKLAEKHGFLLEVRHRGETEAKPSKKKEAKSAEPISLEPRPPVVCVLGHVDHGKTTLLDTIRKTNVVDGEAGGITQHVGAYQVTRGENRITFIDTPGHAAFSKMRERGANVTDVAVLVVAADDGFMPQTDEALKFAQNAGVSLVVAINKIDSRGANIDRVKQQMQERNIASEDWGGEILTVGVSALNGDHIDDLLENVLLQAEVLELKAPERVPAEGVVVESQIEPGRGPTATVIVEKGKLKVGDALVCGPCSCKVRALLNDRGEKLKAAGPGDPALVLGWSEAPESGENFLAVKNDREAKSQAEENARAVRRESLQQTAVGTGAIPEGMDLAEWLKKGTSDQKVYRCVVKSDVHGTVEALVGCLEDIKSERVRIEILESGVGQVSKNDIQLASASEAAIVAFNVRLDNGVQAQAKHHNVQILQRDIIYELIDEVRDAMAALLDPEKVENKIGAAEVRAIFPIARGQVAGCMVTEGQIRRDLYARVLRKGQSMHSGRVQNLKRFKDDVTEVRAGYECGMQVEGFASFEEGDVIECYEIREVRPSL